MSTREIIYAAAGAGAPPTYVEDVFSTYLYTGNGSTQTITNNIDLSGKGGLVWTKGRSVAAWNTLNDTARGPTKNLFTNSTNAETTSTSGNDFSSFNVNGFTLGTPVATNINGNGNTYASWTFRKAPKFFDVVTFTSAADGSATVNHNLGSVPGMVISKTTDRASDWYVTHRSLSSGTYLRLNTTGTTANYAGFQVATSTQITYSTGSWVGNAQIVLYIYAHDAGGFGTSGTDNVISCGSFTGTGQVNLGFEPQFLLIKPYTQTWDWIVVDNMRGLTAPFASANGLYPNTSGAESGGWGFNINATGFENTTFGSSYPCIYMAIRRGPMKTPTSGTEVFTPATRTGTGSTTTITSAGFPVDLATSQNRGADLSQPVFFDRLRGATQKLVTSGTNAETTDSTSLTGFNVQNGIRVGADSASGCINFSSWNYVNYYLRRAPGFFDQVCYTGTGSATTVTHNLGVAPELMIVKSRSAPAIWYVYSAPLGATKLLVLNFTDAFFTSSTYWNDTAPTSSVFSIGTNGGINGSGNTQVAYLFATCPGVSKVGSYTGTGATQTINAGLPTGARFVLIKRTDSTGNWWVWDTARGMVTSTDPRLALNSTAAEINNDWVYTTTNGFQIVTTDATVNASGGSYIYLAIA